MAAGKKTSPPKTQTEQLTLAVAPVQADQAPQQPEDQSPEDQSPEDQSPEQTPEEQAPASPPPPPPEPEPQLPPEKINVGALGIQPVVEREPATYKYADGTTRVDY